MPNWVHRTDKTYLTSVSPASLPEAEANYIEEPDLSAVEGWASKYWDIVVDDVTLMDQTARDAVDAQEFADLNTAIADGSSGTADNAGNKELKAAILYTMDEVNIIRVLIGKQARTRQQIRDAYYAKLGTLGVP